MGKVRLLSGLNALQPAPKLTLPTLSLFIETSNKLIAVHLNALLPACAISEFDSDRS